MRLSRFCALMGAAVLMLGMNSCRWIASVESKEQLLLSKVSSPDVPEIRYRVSDAHFHYVNFLQETDGIDAALRAMDVAGVDHAMITGMPLVKQWQKDEPRRPGYYLEDDARVYWYSATDVMVARENFLRVLPQRVQEQVAFKTSR